MKYSYNFVYSVLSRLYSSVFSMEWDKGIFVFINLVFIYIFIIEVC
jgi:hypothetical protein